MNVFYVISVLLFIASVFFVKKSDKKLNGITWLVISSSLFFCVNVFISFILFFIKIKSSLINLSIVNIFLSIVIYYFNICNKKLKGNKRIQKYYYDKLDVIFAVFILLISFAIGFFRFDNFTTINYETTDPAVHYKTAMHYANADELLTSSNSKDEMYNDFNRALSGYYINCGTFIRTFSKVPSYISFMIFDIIIFSLYGLLFYVTTLEFLKKTSKFKKKILIFIFTMFYVLGYPLSNLLFGFSYLGVGVFAFNFVILAFILFRKKEYRNNIWIPLTLLFFANYLLFFAYYLFVPVVYLAEGLYFIYMFIKKELTLKQAIIIISLVLFVPFILGFCYFILPGLLQSSGVSTTSAIAMEGYIYRNFLSNFIIMFPLFLYSIIVNIKKKDFHFVLLIIMFLFMAFIFYLGMNGKASSYYYYKLYFPFWLLFYLYVVRLVEHDNCNLYIWMNLLTYIIILVMTLTNCERKIHQHNVNFNPQVVAPGLSEIYDFNLGAVVYNVPVLNSEQLLIVDKAQKLKDECVYNKEIPVIGSYMQKLWFYSITDIIPIHQHKEKNLNDFYEKDVDFNEWINDDKSKCLIILNISDDPKSEDYIELDYNNFNILYKNKSGVIIKKLNEK